MKRLIIETLCLILAVLYVAALFGKFGETISFAVLIISLLGIIGLVALGLYTYKKEGK